MTDYEILRRPMAGICDRRPRPKEAQLPPLEDRRRREEDMLIRLRELTLCLGCLCPSFPEAERKSRKDCVANIVSGANLTKSSSATVPSIVLPPRWNKRTSLLYKVGFDELAKKLDINDKLHCGKLPVLLNLCQGLSKSGRWRGRECGLLVRACKITVSVPPLCHPSLSCTHQAQRTMNVRITRDSRDLVTLRIMQVLIPDKGCLREQAVQSVALE